jgi:hypothetical protein
MSYYVRQSDNVVMHINEVRLANPRVSLPDGGDLPSYVKLTETARPAALEWHTVQQADPIDNVQQWVQVPLSAAAIEANITAELEHFFDSKAQERRYDNRITCAMRAGYPGPFLAECRAFAMWMDSCNVYAYANPGSDLVARLPALEW